MIEDEGPTIRIPPSGSVATRKPKREGPALSVVLAGRDCSRALLRMGDLEASLDRPGVDFIYVDGGSSDDSVEIATRMGMIAHLAPDGEDTIWKLWNRGWRAAHGSMVLFLEVGKPFNAYFVARAIRALESSAVGAAILLVPARRQVGTATVYQPIEGGSADAIGHHAVVRRSVLESLDGFPAAADSGTELGKRILASGLGVRGVRVDEGLEAPDRGFLARLGKLIGLGSR